MPVCYVIIGALKTPTIEEAIMEIVTSVNKVSIRITHERWLHITEEHPEMAGCFFEVLETINDPVAIFLGNMEEYLAVREIESGKYIVAVYKETGSDDGFIITAFLTRNIERVERRKKVWP